MTIQSNNQSEASRMQRLAQAFRQLPVLDSNISGGRTSYERTGYKAASKGWRSG
jgi:hypothetical protein